MAEFLVPLVLQRLTDLLGTRVESVLAVSDNITNLRTKLRQMECFLRDADSKKDSGNESLLNLVAEIREAVYDADDLIESFYLYQSANPGGDHDRCFRSRLVEAILRCICIFQRKMKASIQVRSDLEVLTKKLEELTRSLESFGVREIRNSQVDYSLNARRRIYPEFLEREPVGVAETAKKMIDRLVGEEYREEGVAAICGMGGLGKTTLAIKIYNDATDIRLHFHCFGWAFVSQEFKTKEVFEKVLVGLTSAIPEERQRIASLAEDELSLELRRVMKEKKCLVVLDDVWKPQDWDRLKRAFPTQNTNSKIVITSRNKRVAERAHPQCFMLEPNYLDIEQGWDLLQKVAFTSWGSDNIGTLGSSEYARFESLGKEMLQHCSGLPLAIVVLGGILAHKQTLVDWKSVHDKIKAHINSGHGEDDGTNKILVLSFHDLPYYLKPCFLYVGHFPEDYEIPKKKLTQMWIAEGFIVPKRDSGDTMEDVADHYLNELTSRCMLQIAERTRSGKIKCVRIHDIMRDMCLAKASEDNFLTLLNLREPSSQGLDSSESCAYQANVRRLSIFLKQNFHDFADHSHYSKIRSLTYFSEAGCTADNWNPLKSVLKDFEFLRVFSLDRLSGPGKKFPEEIGKLIHLRFLSLRDSGITDLPEAIGNLKCLQTFDMRNTRPYPPGIKHMTLPNVLHKMESLRHLYLAELCYVKGHSKLQLAGLIHLRTLVNFPGFICDVTQIACLTNLRKLVLTDKTSVETLLDIFGEKGAKLTQLKSLYLTSDVHTNGSWSIGSQPNAFFVNVRSLASSFPNLCKLRVDGMIRLPELHFLPQNLTRIILYFSELIEDPMPVLSELPNLMVLHLWRRCFIGKKLTFPSRGFCQLKHLELWYLQVMEELEIQKEAMPKLFRFEISDCTSLGEIPEGVKYLKSLKELQIRYMPYSFYSKLREGGEDFHKIQHLSLSIIGYD